MVEEKYELGIIGAGNMGGIIASMAVKSGLFEGNQIIATNRRIERLEELGKLGIDITNDNKLAARSSETILISVKPKDLETVLQEISELCNEKLVISIAAGKTIDFIASLIPRAHIIRAMPNIGAIVGESLTAIASKNATGSEIARAKEIFDKMGTHQEVEETKMNMMTGVSGSSPAFLLAMFEVIGSVCEYHGMDKKTSRQIMAHNAAIISKLLAETDMTTDELIRMVTSPKGTTEAGFEVARRLDIVSSFTKVVQRSIERAGELSR